MHSKLTRILRYVAVFAGMVLIFKTAYTADRYWVNGSGNWNDQSHWATTSGGFGGASVPSAEDNVFFDANSFNASGQELFIKGDAQCQNFYWQVDEDQIAIRSSKFLFRAFSSASIQVHGSMMMQSSYQDEFYGDIFLKGEGDHELQFSESMNADLIFDAEQGAWTLKSDLSTSGDVVVKSGYFATQSNTIDCDAFVTSGEANRRIDFGDSRILANSADFSESENFTALSNNVVFELKGNADVGDIELGPVSAGYTKSGSKATFKLEEIKTTSTTCYGDDDGTVTVSVSGGNKPYSYTLQVYKSSAWQDTLGATTPDTLYTFNGLVAQDYRVVVEDNGTGGFFSVVTVNQPPKLSAGTITVAQGLSCFDGSDAQLEANPSGGTPPYSYSWYKYETGSGTYVSIGQFSKIATGLDQGLYQVR